MANTSKTPKDPSLKNNIAELVTMAPGISVESKEMDTVRTLDIDEQQSSELSCNQRKKCTGISTLCRDLLRHLRLHLGRRLHEFLNHLLAVLLAGVLDLLELLLSILVRLFFGGLVIIGMLYHETISTIIRFFITDLGLYLTPASDFL